MSAPTKARTIRTLSQSSSGSSRRENTADQAPAAVPFLQRVGNSIQAAVWRATPAPSWRNSVLIFAGSATAVFFLNLAFTIWTVAFGGAGGIDGIGVFAEGDCGNIRAGNIVVHLLINVLSTVLLAGSNFCMQILSAPTRREVDKAHARGKWLDIGVPSVRNWTSVSWTSRTLWLLLGVSSIPLHFFYNSTLFTSTSVNLYDVFLINDRALGAAAADISASPPDTGDGSLDALITLFAQNRLTALSPRDCIASYSTPLQSRFSSVLLVTPDQTNRGRVVTAPRGPANSAREVQAALDFSCGRRPGYQWICSQFENATATTTTTTTTTTMTAASNAASSSLSFFNEGCVVPCDDFVPGLLARPTGWQPFNVSSVSACHGAPSREHCKLMFSPLLAVIVTALNLLKATLMFAVAFRKTEPPLLTVGDAVASFLETTDYATERAGCLLDRAGVNAHEREKRRMRRRRRGRRRGFFWWKGREGEADDDAKYAEDDDVWIGDAGSAKQWHDKKRFKFDAPSFRRWTATLVFYIGSLTVASFLTWYGINTISDRERTIPALEFGAVVEIKTLVPTGIEFMPGAAGLVLNVVAANLAQVLMSIVYFFYNGLFTTMSLAAEWADFAKERKGLRVSSDPVGFQRAAYFLQLPYRYALPLIVTAGVMHWLVSQSIFLVFLEAFTPTPALSAGFVATTTTSAGLVQQRPLFFSAGLTTQLIPNSTDHLVTFGWSPKALVILLSLSVFVLVFLVATGWRRLSTGMPLAGSCSLAIAAACHAPVGEARGWIKPLQWGVVEDPGSVGGNMGRRTGGGTLVGGDSKRLRSVSFVEKASKDRPGHCAFSSRQVEQPREGGWYV